MLYTMSYTSPLGEILVAGDKQGLIGLWIEGQKYFGNCLNNERKEDRFPAYADVKDWLDLYFSGRDPGFLPPLHIMGTEFQRAVWDILLEIPYGKTTTYGAIADKIAQQRGLKRMSAQAVGNAVGRNEISIIIPCHRVVGASGNLTGYAGGIDKKLHLLMLEGVDTDAFFLP